MAVLVVIPARYGSTRFPGKPLAFLHGKPLIQHVYEHAAKAAQAEEVVVATDDERIIAAVARFGGKAVMTSPSARSGTERAAEVARARSAQVVINVQGDEPLVQPGMIDQLADFLVRHGAVPMVSYMTKLSRPQDMANPNIVKVVVDRDGFALYFSRAPIPHWREAQGSRLPGPPITSAGAGRAQGDSPQPRAPSPEPRGFKHLGIYGYQRHFLLQFPSLPPTPLEQSEQLEQLRALEHGYRIKLLEAAHDTVGVDTPGDLKKVEAMFQQSEVSRQTDSDV